MSKSRDIRTPNPKAEQVESMLSMITGRDRKEMITKGSCVTCNAKSLTEDSFKDLISIKEYQISGLCQECQDIVFDSEEE